MASRERDPATGGRLNDGFKQRIVGALVLLALAVIFLPSLFDREGARYIDVTTQIPPAPDIQPIEIADPVPVAGAVPVPAGDDAFQPELPAADSRPEPEAEMAEPAVSESEKLVSEPKPEKNSAPILDAAGLPVAWVVQVAAYREDARAVRLRNRLMDEGYKAYTRAVTTDKGRFVRVFVGPKTSKADAQLVKQELDQLLKAQTLVLRFKA